MERYEEYKDSGVLWLGKIPGHWETRRLGGFFTSNPEINTDFNYKHAYKFNYGSIVYKEEIGNENEYREVYEKYAIVEKNDIMINGLNLNYDFVSQRVAIVPETGIMTSAYLVLRPKPTVVPMYYCYLFKAMDSMKLFHGMGTGIRLTLTFKEVKKQIIPLPPLPEQQAIVSFLDTKTSQIDTYIAGKEKEIDLLKSTKQRIIADAVTKGIKPGVEMRESGIFWLPQIPDSWDVIRLGHAVNKENRPRPQNAELLVCTNKGTVIKKGDSKMGLVADSDEIYQGVLAGDLLIHGMDTWHGAIAVSDFDGMCTPVVHVCTSKNNVHFISYFLQTMAFNKVFKLISNGVRQNTSDFRSWSKLSKLPIALPTIEEQNSIVEFANKKTSDINHAILRLMHQIELIKKYKQRLISDVVTGQIKVC